MDDEGKHAVHSETHLLVSDAASEHAESTDSDIKQNKMYSAVSADCDMFAGIPTHRVDDCNVSQCITYAHERPEDVQAGDAHSRQVDGIHGNMVKCLLSVKCEEHSQALNEQSRVLPASSTDQETNWTNDANETIQVKQEKKEYPDGYDRSSEVTRHWVVCPDGVLEEVKTEHTSDISDILSGEDCNENVDCKLRTRTCTHHNNSYDDEMNGKLSTDPTCYVASTQSRRHDNVLKVQDRTSKGVKHYNCDTCGKQFAYLSQLKMHEMTHTGVKPFTCDTCRKSFAQSGALKMHERIHASVKHFTCTCGKSFSRSGHLKMHEMRHKGIKPFACDICGKSFTQSGDLKRHKRIHTDVNTFRCGTCGKLFTRSGYLKLHEIIHTGVKHFMCDTCGKSFALLQDLKQHELRHEGVKPFACDSCGKSFPRPGELKLHELTHTGIKPFLCDTCGKSFARSGYLKKHERTHTSVKPFTCDACGKSFTRLDYLKQHEMRHTCVKGAS